MTHLLLTLMAATALQTAGPAARPQDAPELFLPAALPQGVVLPNDLHLYYSEHQPVRLNRAVIDPTNGNARPVTITLGARRYSFTLEAVDVRGPEDFTWWGRVEGAQENQLVLTCYRDAAALWLRLPDYTQYTLRFLGNGLYLLCKVRPDLRFKCGTTDGPARTISTDGLPPRDGFETRATAVIRILVVWPPVVRDLLGGDNAAHASAQNDVDLMNNALSNSAVDVHVQLAHTQTINFTQSGDFPTMLSAFRADPTVNSLRDQHECDVVEFLTSMIQGSIVGLGYLPGDYPIDSCGNLSQAFSVCNYVHANTSLGLAHEVGHNLGCGHGYGNDNGGTYYPYSQGYRFDINGLFYYTVMAYDETSGLRTMVPHYSNPNVNYTGTFNTTHPTGDADHDNARTIRENAATIAIYRDRTTAQYVSQDFQSLRNGWSFCPWATLNQGLSWLVPNVGGTIYMGHGYYYEPMIIQRPVILRRHADFGSGNVVIGIP